MNVAQKEKLEVVVVHLEEMRLEMTVHLKMAECFEGPQQMAVCFEGLLRMAA